MNDGTIEYKLHTYKQKTVTIPAEARFEAHSLILAALMKKDFILEKSRYFKNSDLSLILYSYCRHHISTVLADDLVTLNIARQIAGNDPAFERFSSQIEDAYGEISAKRKRSTSSTP